MTLEQDTVVVWMGLALICFTVFVAVPTIQKWLL
jgi:hypothetical protein